MKLKGFKEHSRAQTMVEFALVLPILLMLIFGLLEVGRLIFVYSTIVSASREGARYGTASGLNGGVPRYQDCAGIRAAAQKVDFLNSFTDADITITYDKGGGITNTCPGVPSPEQVDTPPLSRIRVQVSALYTPLAGIVPINSFTITSSNARTIIGKVIIEP